MNSSRAGYGAAALGTLTLLLSPSAVPQAAACLATKGPLPVLAPTLSVKVSAARPSYARGQVAVMSVEVHMVRQDGPKVAGAEVTITVSAGSRVVRRLYGETDASGVTRPTLTTRGLSPGRLTAVASVRSLVANGYDCSGLLYHSGQGTADPLTTVR